MHASFFSYESGRSTFPEESCTLKASLVVTHENILILILFFTWLNFADNVCIFNCFMKFAIHCTAKVKLSLQLSFMLISMQAMEQNQKRKGWTDFILKLDGDNCLTGAFVLVEPSLVTKNKASLKQIVSFGYCSVDYEMETNTVKCCRRCCNRTSKS